MSRAFVLSIAFGIMILACTSKCAGQIAKLADVEPSRIRTFSGVVTGGPGATISMIPSLPRNQNFIITDVVAFDISYSATFADLEFRQGDETIARLAFNGRAGYGGTFSYHFVSGIPVKAGLPVAARVVRDGGYEGMSILIGGYLYRAPKAGTTTSGGADLPELSGVQN